MRMPILIASFLTILLTLFTPSFSKAAEENLILSDAFITTLSPHISNAVVGHYGELTQFGLYDVEVISINRTQNGRNFNFIVVLKIFPYEKAHNYIGEDTLTLEINPSGVNVTKYIHEKTK